MCPMNVKIKVQVPKGYWKCVQHQRKHFDWLSTELNIRNTEDWYTISPTELSCMGGTHSILKMYQGCLWSALEAMYPSIAWQPWRFAHAPHSYWQECAHHLQYFEWLAHELDIKEPNQWYGVHKSTVLSKKGTGMLRMYGRSLSEALSSLYPEYTWHSWRFEDISNNFWDSIENQRQFIAWIGNQLKISDIHDWYQHTVEDVEQYGGNELLTKYNHSLWHVLRSIYPDVEWHPWRFSPVPTGFWNSLENHKWFMDWLGGELGIKYESDWYKVTKNTIVQYGGSGMLSHYDSVCAALQAVYPEVKWQLWRFAQNSHSFWNNFEYHHQFLDWFEKKLHIANPIGWESVTNRLLHVSEGGPLLAEYRGSLVDILNVHRPGEDWQRIKWTMRSKSKSQQYLVDAIQTLFPRGTQIVVNATSRLLKCFTSERSMQLDVWIPAFNVAIEYQGCQHFEDQSDHLRDHELEEQMARDSIKSSACEEAGIALIQIPFWWDYNIESLPLKTQLQL